MTRVVLVTGVSRYLGGRFARAAEQRARRASRVIGVDVIPPPHDIGGAQFVRADIRNPMIAKVIADSRRRHRRAHERHRDPASRPAAGSPRRRSTSSARCSCSRPARRRRSLQRLVVKSSSAVYGTSPARPGHVHRGHGPKAMPRSGFGKDSVEVEGYVRGLLPPSAGCRGLDAALRQHHRPGHPDRADRLLHAARSSRCRSATTRGSSSSTRTTPSRRCGSPRPGSAGRRRQRRRRRRDHDQAGRPADRPADHPGPAATPAAGSGSWSGAPGWPTSRRTR